MNSHDEPFQPESVEKQIQKLLKKRSRLQDGNSANVHLICELQDLYDENAAILDHTWERIAAELVDADRVMKNAPLQHAQTGKFGSAKQTKQTDRRSLPLLLAGLVALLLIASMAMAFSVFMKQKTASPSPTPSPLSNAIYLNYTNTHSSQIIKRDSLTGVVAWRYPLPATTTVMDQSIVGNTLYVMVTNRHIYAVNIATGTALWIWSIPEKRLNEVIIPQKMVVSEKIVYVITDQIVYKVNTMSGTVTGSYLIGDTMNQDNSGQAARFTHCLVESNMLYVIVGSMFYAYRLSDGTQIWQVWQPSDGTQIWQVPLPTDIISGISSAQHILYVASLYYKKTDNLNTNIYISAVDMRSGNLLWSRDQEITFTAFVNISVTASNSIVSVSISSKDAKFVVLAFDTQRGKMLWNWDKKTSLEALIAKKVYIEAGLLFFDASGQGSRRIIALNAENGSTKWSFPINGPMQAFTIQNGVIYATTSSTTYALNASNGSVLWKAVNPF